MPAEKKPKIFLVIVDLVTRVCREMSSNIIDNNKSNGRYKAPEASTTASQVHDHIARALREVRYGSVEIIVHDGKVVSIERREKARLETNGAATS